MIDPELLKAFELIAEFDKKRSTVTREYRLYYREDGSIIGLWETDHPDGNYIVLDDPAVFNNTNTHLLVVVNGELKVIDPTVPPRLRVIKSHQGQLVVRNQAALAVYSADEYHETEYYDRKTDY